MPWTASHMFRAWIADTINSVTTPVMTTDIPKIALYGNTGTPDENATSALSAYNAAASQWVVANEVSQSVQWPAGGVAVSGIAWTPATTADAVWYTASNTASGSAATLAAVFGCLVYDDTLTTPVADQGECFNYFGGTNSVTAGTFTVVWNALGIWRITL